jgi:metal-responsive CopG/Arc/MetJ family transcriptional regulator
MPDRDVIVRLNQQQLELLDRTVGEQASGGRGELIAQALDEYYAEHFE